MNELEPVIDAHAMLGEGPSWDAENSRLFWVDILGKQLNIYNSKAGTNRSIQFEQYVCAVVPRNSEEVILAMQHGYYSYHIQSEELKLINDPEEGLPDNRFNDGKCDPGGRFWAGTMDFDGAKNKGALYCLDTDLSVKKVLSPVSVSNGLAWSPDQTRMYFNDTPTQKVFSFDYDVKTGKIKNQQTAVEISTEEGSPDGMTIDTEGMIWVAHWGGAKVSRWNPETGKRLDEILLPCSKVTSCVFGGEDLDELFITTARTGIEEKELAEQPQAGGVFRIKTNVKGLPTDHFIG